MSIITNYLEKRIHYAHPEAIMSIVRFLKKFIYKNSVFLCIGTDKCIGDSLGPIVGSKLKKTQQHLDVYGTLKEPVHAINIIDTIHIIRKKHYNKNIVAIDACLGDSTSIGDICIKNQPLFPGKGVGKNLPPVGDISIIGIVDVFETYSLHNTRLSLVMDMADVISEAVLKTLNCP